MSRKSITRAKIIEAALFSAFKNGMGAVSLSDIAQSLQIKKASLYNYFSGKEELLCAVYEYADDFYSRVNFLDEEIFAKIDSASVQKEFKSITEEFVRAHEREPLLQICILVFSEKYFNRNCLEIFQKQKSKLQKQSLDFFKFASTIWKKKIPLRNWIRLRRISRKDFSRGSILIWRKKKSSSATIPNAMREAFSRFPAMKRASKKFHRSQKKSCKISVV